MFSWLSSESSTPDLIIEVGPPPFARFPVHSSVLTIHSGYLRAAIIRANDSPIKSLDNIIYLPNITIDQFGPLLTYMYTGFLDLNLENIFGVLLATHLLHMPQALELCRNFLSRTQQQQQEQTESYLRQFSTSSSTSGTSKVIRPIASKANSSGINFVSPPSNSLSLLVPSHETSFKSISSLISEPLTQGNAGILEKPRQSPPKIIERREVVRKVASNPQKFGKLVDSENWKEFGRQKPESSGEKAEKSSVVQKMVTQKPPVVPTIKKTIPNEENECSNSEKVIIDIASCDGPVRFRRVLNEAFDINKNLSPLQPAEESKSDFLGSFKHQSKSFHQQMARNINEQIYQQNLASEESENSQQSGNLNSNEVFTCVYCKHTFKSQYCYQKHAKRHLNPLNLKNFKCGQEDLTNVEPIIKKVKVNEDKLGKRDSIKPLDMNVQYYPCKTCGCKFPSYYFVHKHRKMCHPELLEENLQQNQTNQSQNQNSDENKDSDSLCSINVVENENDEVNDDGKV